MDTTVERLKVGTQVIIGSYGVNNDEPHPVVWLKGSPNCDFITECAVDYLCFDAPEKLETAGAILVIPTIVCPIFIHT